MVGERKMADAAPLPGTKRERSVLGAIGKVAALKQEQVGEGGDEVVALLPINFFKVKKDATPKAPLSVLVKVAVLAYIITMGIGFGLFYYELTKVTITEETTVSATTINGQTCTSLGAWTNGAAKFTDYEPFRTSVGIEVQIDISWTQEQCFAATANTCETWADAYVGKGTDASCCMSSAAVESNCYSAFPPAAPHPPVPSSFPPSSPPVPPSYPAWNLNLSPPPVPSPPSSPPPPPAIDGVNYCGGTKVAAKMSSDGSSDYFPAASVDWYYNDRYARTMTGWTLYRGSGMLNSVAVVNDSMTTTRDVPGIHVASYSYPIVAQPDENGVVPENQLFQVFSGGSSQFEPGHEAHFKALTNFPRSMLALTTCKAIPNGEKFPAYMCAGAGVSSMGDSVYGGRSDTGRAADGGPWRLAPDYLTSKIFARYPTGSPSVAMKTPKGAILLTRVCSTSSCRARTSSPTAMP